MAVGEIIHLDEVSASAALVGRDHEVRSLWALLRRAAVGRGSVALVSGEAGIGKTRLCDEVAAAHRKLGGQVLRGSTSPEDAAVPFGPIADALRAARRGEPRF